MDDFEDFIQVFMRIVKLAIDIPHDSVQAAIEKGKLNAFISLLHDLERCLKPQKVETMKILDRLTAMSLRREIHNLADAQPSLRAPLQGCMTAFLNLYIRRTIVDVLRSDSQSVQRNVTCSTLISGLEFGEGWFGLVLSDKEVVGHALLGMDLQTIFDHSGRGYVSINESKIGTLTRDVDTY